MVVVDIPTIRLGCRQTVVNLRHHSCPSIHAASMLWSSIASGGSTPAKREYGRAARAQTNACGWCLGHSVWPYQTGKLMGVDSSHTTRDLLRVGLLVFGLFLVWRFLAGIVTTVLLLSTGLLLAVALSGPVEALHRRKVPRPIAAGLVTVVVLALLRRTLCRSSDRSSLLSRLCC
jgi:hypothetical protein